MTQDRWRQIAEIYEAVVDRPAADRESVLGERCRGDAVLRREVETSGA